ncbi:MAG: NAD(P)H-binding protein [Armatimonadetes bacterium]|nr:NAD(P)H-binding protein [Armatimonadota bacterium]
MPLDVVTGAFSYTGRYLTKRLLTAGHCVRTLTGRRVEHRELDVPVEIYPYNFDDYEALLESLRGASTFYITYWVRYPHGETTYEKAVENTKMLFRAAKDAGVRRVVYVSIANPSLDSPLPYYRGKAQLEEALMSSGVSCAILRPTVIFGAEDVLINNIAWIVRRFPVFAVPGDGHYALQPIFVEDMAQLMLEAGQREDSFVQDAAGPEVFTFDDLIRTIARVTGRKTVLLHLSADLALGLSRIIGLLVRDVVLTREEVLGLMDNLLISGQPSLGRTLLSDWLAANAGVVGARYHNEIARHFR